MPPGTNQPEPSPPETWEEYLDRIREEAQPPPVDDDDPGGDGDI